MKILNKIKNYFRRMFIFIRNYIRRGWQWLIGHTWGYFIQGWQWFMYATFNTWYNTFMYKKYCRRSWKLSQRLNGQRVYIFPKPDGKQGLHLVTSGMLAEENRKRSKRKRIDIRALALHSYGWSDKNTNAYKVFRKFSKDDNKRYPQKSGKD